MRVVEMCLVCAVVVRWLLRSTYPYVTHMAPTCARLSCAADPAAGGLRVCAVPTIRRPDGDDGKSSSFELAMLSIINAIVLWPCKAPNPMNKQTCMLQQTYAVFHHNIRESTHEYHLPEVLACAREFADLKYSTKDEVCRCY